MEMISSRMALGIIAGLFGTIFVGYCIYFDQKRHNDPNFRRKLHEKRQAKKLAASSGRRKIQFPDMKDHDAVQRFFLQEIQLGEELLSVGDLENGVDHIANSMAVCGQPNELLKVLQQSLQPQAFHMLMQRLQPPNFIKSSSGSGVMMEEEDVE